MPRRLGFLASLALLLWGGTAFAQADLHNASQSYMGLLELVRNTSNQWSPRLHGLALYVFWSLATIQLVWICAQLVLKQTDTSVFLLEFLRWIMVTGFFFAVLENFVPWAQAVVDSFRQAGGTASGTGMQLHPGDMFGLAVELAHMVAEAGTMNIADGVLIAMSAMIILVSFVFIAVFMGVTLIESYIAVNAAVLFMGFGGSQWTREFAITMMKYPVSVGAKLFVLTLIVDLIMNSARTWQHAYHHDQASMWTMVGLSLVCAYLAKTIPDLIQALINGVSSSGGSSLGGMAAAGMAFGAGAMASLQSSGLLSGISGGLGSVADSVKSGLGMSGASGGPSMSQMSGGSSFGGGGSYSSGPSSRTGGGGNANPGPAPSQAGSSGQSGNSGSSGPSGPVSGGSNSASSSSSSSPMNAATAAHMATDAAVRSAGVLASMAVPGMEGSESLTVGAPPTPSAPPDYSSLDSQPGYTPETPENVIRPAGPAAPGPQMETMNDLQEILNNKGKPPHENI